MDKNKFNTILIILIAIITGLIIYVFLCGLKPEISSIELSSKTIGLFVGDNKKLDVSVLPEKAANNEVVWISSNPGIASVNRGVVTGISEGDAIITVKSKDNDVSDSLMVRVVKKEATELSIYDGDIEIRINEFKNLGVLIEPIELKDLITWASSDERIATVDNYGKVTGISNGVAIIKAIYGDKEAISEVRVVLPISSLDIEKTSTLIYVNNTEQLNLIINPESSSNQEAKWESSNPDVATVENGLVKGISEGKATITATLDGLKVTCEVEVAIPAESIVLNKKAISLNKGSSESILATVSPIETTNKNITWTSSNPKAVKVENGKVTGVGTGKSTITATIDGKSATCEVTSIGYVITQDSKFTKYKTVALYNSDTLKYIIKKDGGNFYSIIWVMDSYQQLNSALPQLGTSFSGDVLLSKEISQYGYQRKGLIATNASYFWAGWGETPGLPFLVNKGKIIRDIQNIDYGKPVYGTLGITKDGLLKTYTFYKNSYSKNLVSRQELLNDGVRSVFAYTVTVIGPDGKVTTGTDRNDRTIICQVDENNFVLYSGSSLSFGEIGRNLKNIYGCKLSYNLDGGGSRKLYYKTGSMSSPTAIYTGGRKIPDMLYFVEQ